jgi:hypothetical protein
MRSEDVKEYHRRLSPRHGRDFAIDQPAIDVL